MLALLTYLSIAVAVGQGPACKTIDKNSIGGASLLQSTSLLTSRAIEATQLPQTRRTMYTIKHHVGDGLKHSNTKENACLDATAWYTNFTNEKPWRKYSQGHQDSFLASLFNSSNLGTTNRFFVEFGYQPSYPPNTKLLAEKGWTGFEMDEEADESISDLHKEFITSDNIVSLFVKYKAPVELDYVSIDIDSCDLWVFLALTQKYRPRVISVEYNSHYTLEESKSNICKDKAGVKYAWNGDDLYGASLLALHRAAERMGYTMVAVEKKLDVFLVRKDLVCPGTGVALESFRRFTELPMHKHASHEEFSRWTVDYNPTNFPINRFPTDN